MSGYVWFALAVILAIFITAWIAFTATRLDRLHARVDAAQAALDAQLLRRAAALQHVADRAVDELGKDTAARMAAAAHAALVYEADGPATSVDAAGREGIENDVGKAANELGRHQDALRSRHADALHEIAESANKVLIARRFYNDAVRDTRSLRAGRMPRLLRLAGHRARPEFFDIDDSTEWSVSPLHGGTR